MSDAVKVINHVQLVLFLLLFSLALLYTGTILFVRRFHHPNNFLTVNFCIAVMCSAIYWSYFYIRLLYHPKNLRTNQSCLYLLYFEMMTTLQIPLTTVLVSIHRLCAIVYHQKQFFRKKTFIVICVACQWLVGILSPIPRYQFLGPVRIFLFRGRDSDQDSVSLF